MLNCNQLKEFIIKPALCDLMLYSDVAMELMVFTCANESDGGKYIKQIKGPALGIYQMEPETYNDLWANYLNNKPSLMLILNNTFDCNRMPSEDRLIYDLRFATAMARIHYARIQYPLPSVFCIDGIWNYYKKFYNTPAGKAEYITAVNKYNAFTSAT